MNKYNCQQIFAKFEEVNPNPSTELVYNSIFELLIAVILSAQATDISVNKCTEKLFEIANNPQAILNLGLEKLKTYIKSIGLYNTKAENIIKTCNILARQYAGEVPSQRAALEALPGVGRKTANVVLNTAFGESTIAVDTHIFRVSHRTGLSLGKTPLAVEKDLLKKIDKQYLKNAHHWLVLHGRYVCLARKPKCEDCLISKWCDYFSNF